MTKILLVDDSEEVIAVLSHRFKALNFEVKTAEAATVAIGMLQAESFDVVLSDVVMPGMNGVEFMNAITGLPGAFQTIFMSGTASETTKDTLIRMGALGFMKKPLDFDELIKLIDKATGKFPESQEESKTKVVHKASGNMHRANVMVVDDMVVVADLLQTLLAAQGFNTFVAHNGEEALKMYQENKINLVVTDLVMPKMNGVELIKALKSLNENLPILAITGEAMNLSIQDALNYGASMCVRKPFPNKLFVEKVENLFMEFKRGENRQQAVEKEQNKPQAQKLTWKEKFHRDPVTAISMGGVVIFSFLLAAYVGSYAFLPPKEGQSVIDVDDRMDQLIEAIRMDWGR